MKNQIQTVEKRYSRRQDPMSLDDRFSSENKSFSSYLEEFLTTEDSDFSNENQYDSPARANEYEGYRDYGYLHHLLAQKQTITSAQPSPQSYFSNNKVIRTRKSHSLTKLQSEAYETLNFHLAPGQKLHAGFNLPELKKAFRSCARSTHPDLGGHASDFHKIKKSYEILLAFALSIK